MVVLTPHLFTVWCRFITHTCTFTLSQIYFTAFLFYLLYGVGLLPIQQYLFKRVVRVYRPRLYFYLNVWSRISAHTSTFTLSQIYFYLKYYLWYGVGLLPIRQYLFKGWCGFIVHAFAFI